MTTLLARLLRPWRAIAPLPFQGMPLPALDGPLALDGGIHADQDVRLFQWFNQEHGPVSSSRDDLRGIHARGDLWALEAGRRLASALTITRHASEIDIRELAGFGASRSDLRNLATIEAMHQADGRPTPASTAAADALARQVVDRHRGQLDIDLFPQQGRMWLSNEDGSHRMAAAIVAARRLGTGIRVPARIRTYLLDGEAIAAAARDHGIFVVAPGPHLAELRLHAGQDERFTLAQPRFTSEWPPTLLLTQHPAGRIPGALGRMVDALLDQGAAEPLSTFLRRHVPALSLDPMSHVCAPSPFASPSPT
jgi:hypothetical protein